MRSLTDLLHLGGDVENIECLGGLAVVGEVADVLERVVLPFTAVFLVGAHQETKTVEVGNLESLSGVLTLEQLIEDVVNLHSVGDFFLEFKSSLVGLVIDELVVKVIELDITRVNNVLRFGKVILLKLLFSLAQSLLEDVVTAVALEATDVLFLEGFVTELLNWGIGSLLSNKRSLLSKSFAEHMRADIRILHPVGGE
eukprot:CAMPEP_0176375128 /NCGR_PEP_ID=MMETSP0126-20121128/27288_1 /TAXON_ID=141414 ORGANISM="Strombidinopsis acuminatum, Strain SPMC142" /NCGR_SAMPLE_ID=MMETSP0126 /ASSEMBLY_ACC=CAM_ASM_000229 /LENGTH=197 /DNA_ID=CAMNT_0017736075 /DNA_START=91 /DNA_END=684 /DNA_ORIENTATION=-